MVSNFIIKVDKINLNKKIKKAVIAFLDRVLEALKQQSGTIMEKD